MRNAEPNVAREVNRAKLLFGDLTRVAVNVLKSLVARYGISVTKGHVTYFNGRWYVTHAGLLNVAERSHCAGIHVRPILKLSDPVNSHWVFRAAVFKTQSCKGFVGYGDADPSNVSSLVHGAEMRVAETRAVNRALRKAYGIGICSVEELGTSAAPCADQKRPPQPVSGNGANGHARLRDRLWQLVRQHRLDAALVKAYAIDFCRVSALKEAKREQVEAFVEHIAEWAAKDRNALICQLNSYHQPQQGAA
jgi:hypothetical protein